MSESIIEPDELPPNLQAVVPESFRITRRKHGKTWRYYYTDKGGEVRGARLLRHLEGIPVPNTWTRVRLCSDACAHILASGYDGSGKLQYLYHEEYREFRNLRKFDELYDFGAALPRIRRRVRRDLNAGEWTQTRLLALLVTILDRYHLRVGTRVYASQHGTFGLTTLRKKHLKEHESELVFDYLAKGGKRRLVHLADPELVALVREVAEFPGWELFSIHQGGHKITADAQHINDYLRRISGGDFTARNFRTWGGTVSCLKLLRKARLMVAENPRRQLAAVLTQLAADELGNTPTICRQYYIHPGIFAAVLADDFDPEPTGGRLPGHGMYRKYECRAMELLGLLRERTTS